MLLLSLVLLLLAAVPRVKGPAESLIFFRAINDIGEKTFRERINNLTIEEYLSDLMAQCYRNAEIATAKFRWVRWSFVSLFVGVIFWLVTILLVYRGGQ